MVPTIKEIARLAGVSKSTVSRVVTGNGYASPEAKEKILNTIRELQYKPNAVARAMVSKRTKNIGVIIYRDHQPIASHPLYGKILDAILESAGALGYSVFVTTDKEMSLRSADFMLEKRVDGLILISRLRNNVIEYIKSFGVPYLMVNGTTEDEEVIHIVNQDEKGGRLAAEYLERNHERIAMMEGPQEHRSHFLRSSGFRTMLEQLGKPLDASSVYSSEASTFESGYRTLELNWAHFVREGFTALFCTNDMMALGAMKVLAERGIQIPGQVAVMGYDNVDLASMYQPSMTTIAVDTAKMGHDAVIILDKLMKEEAYDARTIEQEPQLIIRQST
ncbi:LacI family DNA-binding transcriptional regulator [Paenibacillus sp. LHD-117]|uniref:LacI family DNA-binding transcriptional regulator n=1 Tax=Paenibacillus sp. LHD-117 TaxID=3071412 RepID=UPI0027DEBA94|nr:LacI family DNA-binding transcriptional regulator [Paenibacillus sp. LHD-117]MDQ6419400.1 LacI family DNA-binding transcriptional regulator [Paenibacillus sp. LHD-117]